MLLCKNQCDKYKAKQCPKKFRYAEGQKFCSICSIYIIWEGKRCPCCGANLRTRPLVGVSKYKDEVRYGV